MACLHESSPSFSVFSRSDNFLLTFHDYSREERSRYNLMDSFTILLPRYFLFRDSLSLSSTFKWYIEKHRRAQLDMNRMQLRIFWITTNRANQKMRSKKMSLPMQKYKLILIYSRSSNIKLQWLHLSRLLFFISSSSLIDLKIFVNRSFLRFYSILTWMNVVKIIEFCISSINLINQFNLIYAIGYSNDIQIQKNYFLCFH